MSGADGHRSFTWHFRPSQWDKVGAGWPSFPANASGFPAAARHGPAYQANRPRVLVYGGARKALDWESPAPLDSSRRCGGDASRGQSSGRPSIPKSNIKTHATKEPATPRILGRTVLLAGLGVNRGKSSRSRRLRTGINETLISAKILTPRCRAQQRPRRSHVYAGNILLH